MTDSVATDYVCWPAVELAAAIRAGELSSQDLLANYLARIDQLDGPVNSVVTLARERAMAEAVVADAQVADGAALGPLHGVPCTVKDVIETEGIRSTAGAPEFAEHVPDRDATAVARLRAAGAIVFGKTNVPMFAGDMQSDNELFGATSNPWDTARSAGGSSGGAAAAVASGLTGFELGTDIGGSIRIPSHLCGVFGLRPSYGVVPTDGYLAGVRQGRAALDINVFGPIARDAGDLELLLNVLAGAPRSDEGWSVALPRPRADRLSGYRFGLWLDDDYCPVAADYAEVLRGALDRLVQQGARLAERHPSVEFADSFKTYWKLLMSATELNASAGADRQLTHRDWLIADDRRLEQRDIWQRWFASGYDVLLCPVLATAAYPHDHTGYYGSRYVTVDGTSRSHAEIARWTGLVGALGLPVATVPIGSTAAGLPVGLQVIAPRLRDRDAVRVAGLIAEATGGYQRPPGF